MTRVLVVAPNWLGDAVMALPALSDLRRAWPDAILTVAATPGLSSLFRLVREVDDIVDSGKARPVADVGILLPNSFRSALRLVLAGVPQRWGYRTDCRGPLLTRAIDAAPAHLHQVDYYQHLLRALGCPSGPAQPRLDVGEEVRAAGRDLLERAGWNGTDPLAAIAPGGAFGSAKRWPPSSFAALICELARDGIRSVVVGARSDAALMHEIERHVGHPVVQPLDIVGWTDLPALAGVLMHAGAIVANDSGVMHLGSAAGVPTIGLFGPTDERRTAPRSAAAHAVLSHPVWCRPCMLRECPLEHTCMRGITVAAVADAARRLA
jgi:heptosyltransferase-2